MLPLFRDNAGVSSPPGPTVRALHALAMLQSGQGVTADEVANRLGVSQRAVRRYIDILREAGIPIESWRGRYGGYRLGRGARLAPIVFTEDEALGLVMAVLEGHPAAITDEELIGLALSKLIRALPEPIGRQATTLREYAAAAPDLRNGYPDPAITTALVVAVASHHQVRLRYRSEVGNEWDERVDPWAVVVRHGAWYLLCHSRRAGAVRTYRIDRVQAVETTPQLFAPPEGLEPVAALEEHLGQGWTYPTRVVFAAPVSQVSAWVHPPMGRLSVDPRGCVLVGSTNNPAMYAEEWLARIPLAFRVEGGEELRSAVAALASRCAAALVTEVPDPHAS